MTQVSARVLSFWQAAAVLLVAALAATGCSPPSEDAGATPEFEPTATVQDIMLSMVDPSADAIWESVATIVTPDGIEERRPRTDEEWQQVRHHAVILVESTNLLLMPRAVAKPGVESENPGIELEPEQIAELIDKDREAWDEHTHTLHDTALVMLEAAEARDAQKLFDNGGPLDEACETCHRQYWYPENVTSERAAATPAAPPAAEEGRFRGGTLVGRVHLEGPAPGNAVIRMGKDPRCAEINKGRTVVQESVAVDGEGHLANVFIRVLGSFPPTPVPDEPVVVDQDHCIFEPRVVGARAGQTVRFVNSDPLLHNVHSAASQVNVFNLAQPIQGTASDVSFAAEDGMVRVQCDVHSWMTEYVGVVDHPYFAVSDADGAFTIEGVPAGTHTVQAWQEAYGTVSHSVTVADGETAEVDFSFAAADAS